MNVSRAISRLRSRRHLFVRVVMVMAFVLAVAVVSYMLFRTFSPHNDSGTMTPRQREQLRASYNTAVSTIKDDTGDGRIDDKQARLVHDKLDEVYAFRQATNSNEQSGKEALAQKRRDLREWAAKNGVPYHYFVGIFRQ